MASSVIPHRLGPILFGPPLLNVWHAAQTLAICSPFLGSALASNGPIGSGPAAAPSAAGALVVGSAPATMNTGFSSSFGRTSCPAKIPDAIATIMAVSTDAMLLFHSNDDIDARSSRDSTELSRFRRPDEPGMLSLSKQD